MRKRWLRIGVLIVGLFLISAAGMNPLSSRAAPPFSAPASRTHDGYADLVTGIPYDNLGTLGDAGSIYVRYGSSGGLSAGLGQAWNQDFIGGAEPYTGSPAEANDKFGYALAGGDFDGDGYIDLAIGVRWESIGTASNGGAVHVLYGSSSLQGLSAAGHQFWHQGTPGVDGAMEDGDQFGYALAAGDFDGDGYDDLAIGVPYEDIEPETGAGCVNVLYGSPSGLTASGNQLFYQGHSGLWDQAEDGDQFGQALAAGNFDGDDYDDLAIGVPQEDVWGEGVEQGGAVHVLYGSGTGLTTTGQQLWEQFDLLGLGESEGGDWFGYALAVGNFDGDSYDDLAVGVPDESLTRDATTIVRAGAVNVIYGSAAGLSTSGNQYWHQDVSGVLEWADPEDQFGYALAAGNFDGDDCDDLAVGVRHESVGSTSPVDGAGSVNVLYGSAPLGLTTAGQQLWNQNSEYVWDEAEEYDRFGSALAAGDFDGDSRDDLAVGVPDEDIGSTNNCGVVNVLYGSAGGLSGMGNWLFMWDSTASGANDEFGYALVALPAVENKVYLPLVLQDDGS
jgi:FG-GAP repeat